MTAPTIPVQDSELLAAQGPTSRPKRASRHPVASLVVRRVLGGMVVLILVSAMVFVATQALPGDAARAILGKDATPARVAALRQQLGLDQPLLAQYVSWLGRLLRGDLGTSLASGQSVGAMLAAPVRNSAVLVGLSAMISLPLALVSGMWLALRRGRRAERAASSLMLALASLPEFVVGVAVIMIFATGVFHWLPAVSIIGEGQTPASNPRVLVLPTLTIVILVVPYVSRMVRAAMADVLDSDFVEMARLKGVPERTVIFRHALPNAMAPIAQVFALVLAVIAGGSVVVETLFAYPGVGLALVSAVRLRDLPVIQVLTLGVGALYIFLSITADIASLAFTPRARTSAR